MSDTPKLPPEIQAEMERLASEYEKKWICGDKPSYKDGFTAAYSMLSERIAELEGERDKLHLKVETLGTFLEAEKTDLQAMRRMISIAKEKALRLTQENERIRSALMGFVEYFNAIERGEYESNGRAKRIRDFERLLIDKAMCALNPEEG